MPRRLYHAAAFDPARSVHSWWRASAPALRHAAPPLDRSVSCDVAIIGAGYTGLNAALRLAGDYGLDVRVLDMGEPGFGASGRNGGFCCIPATKLDLAALIKADGLDATRRFFDAQLEAIDHVADILDRQGIDADRHSNGGELALAHRPSELDSFRKDAAFMKDAFGIGAQVYPREALAQLGAEGPDFHGAMIHPYGFALHPLKYLRGLADAAMEAGAVLHGKTEVTALREEAGRHLLTTAAGTVTARHLIVATNGYTDETVPDWLGGRLLPVLSGILVTRPLSETERRAQGFTTDLMAYDTRTLLHYFRLMPDGRFLFGGRGGVRATPDGLARTEARLRRDFERMFPAWANVEITHAWSGFVALAANLTPYIGRIADHPTAWTALAFHGNGVATGSWAGARLADLIAGAMTEDDLPEVFRRPLRRFPIPALRPAALAAAYLWAGLTDSRR